MSTYMNTAETYTALFSNKELIQNLKGIILDNEGALVKQRTTEEGSLSVTVIFPDNSALIINKSNKE